MAFDRYGVAVINPAEVTEHQVTASEAASLVAPPSSRRLKRRERQKSDVRVGEANLRGNLGSGMGSTQNPNQLATNWFIVGLTHGTPLP
jgi:hypothetical protein